MSEIGTVAARHRATQRAQEYEASAASANADALVAVATCDFAFAASRAADAVVHRARAARYKAFLATLPAPPPSGITFTFTHRA